MRRIPQARIVDAPTIQINDNNEDTHESKVETQASIVAPLMLSMAALAKPLVVALIGEKWLPCVPYLQLLAIGWMVDPIISVNLNVLYVKGRSDVVLRLEIIKKIIAIVIVVVSVQFGIIWLCVGRVIYGIIALFLNLYFCAPYIGMGIARQIREVSSIYLVSAVVAMLAWVSSDAAWEWVGKGMNFRPIFSCFAGVFAGGSAFIILGWLCRFELVQMSLGVLHRRQSARNL